MDKNEQIQIYKLRSFGEIINDTFTLLRHGFKPLGKAILYYVGPLILLMAIIGGYIYTDMFGGFLNELSNLAKDISPKSVTNSSVINTMKFLIGILVLTLFSIIAIVLMHLYSYEYIKLYEKIDYNTITLNLLLNESKKKFWKLFFTDIFLILFIIVIYVILMIIAFNTPILTLLVLSLMLYILITLSLVPVIRVNETIGLFSSVKRSFQLITGNWWSTFGMLIVVFIIITFAGMIFSIPYIALMGFIVFHQVKSSGVTIPYFKPLFVITYAIQMVGYLLTIIPIIAVGLKYYSIVEKKEGAGLLKKVDTIVSPEKTVQ